MPSILLNKDTAGPHELVEGRLNDGSLDFRTIPPNLAGMFRISLLRLGGISAALNFIIPRYTVINSNTIQFEIPDVGPLNPSGNTVPEGSYAVNFNFFFWSAIGVPGLRIVANRATNTLPGGTMLHRLTPTSTGIAIRYAYPAGRAFATFMSNLSLLYLRTRNFFFRLINIFAAPIPPAPPTDADLFFDNLTAGGTPGLLASVQPLIDAEENFPEIEKLISSAQKFIYIVDLGLDEKTNLKHTAQNRTGTISWTSIEETLKATIARPRPSGDLLDIKVLLWETFVLADSNEYEDHFSDVGKMGITQQQWGLVKGNSFQQFLTNIRPVSTARESILRTFYTSYHNAADSEVLPFPTGIEIALENHPTQPHTGAHHQKFILTDQGAWVAGMDLLMHHWDTHAHIFADTRRAHSGEGVERPVPGEVLPWHDTGALVKGTQLGKIFRVFSTRWDKAVVSRGPYDPLSTIIDRRFSSLATYLHSSSVTDGSKFNGRPAALNSPVDLNFGVERFSVAVSLPRGAAWANTKGITEIKDFYYRSLDAMAGNDSFVYMENQFFNNYDFTKKIFERWKRNVSLPGNEGYNPFCYILIPYRPDPKCDWISTDFIPTRITKTEMENIKWLEIKTARIIYKKSNTGLYMPYCEVINPERNIRFNGAVDNDPSQLDESAQFTVTDALELDSSGMRVMDVNGQPKKIDPNPTLRVDEVITRRGDIMSYTLVTTRKENGGDIRPNIVMGEDIPDRVHEFLFPHHIYIHSKCSVFYNRESNVFIATIGSANTNVRSFDDQGDHQDSELNIWWTGREHVEKFRNRLWMHHLRIGDPDEANERNWAEKGWRNFFAIMSGSGHPLEGDVVRLDVVDRADKIPWPV